MKIETLELGQHHAPVVLITIDPKMGPVTRALGPGETVTVAAQPDGKLSIQEHVIYQDEAGTRVQISQLTGSGDFIVNTRDQCLIYWFSLEP